MAERLRDAAGVHGKAGPAPVFSHKGKARRARRSRGEPRSSGADDGGTLVLVLGELGESRLCRDRGCAWLSVGSDAASAPRSPRSSPALRSSERGTRTSLSRNETH